MPARGLRRSLRGGAREYDAAIPEPEPVVLALPADITDFFQQGVAAAVSACGHGLQPCMARVVGVRVDARGVVTVLLLRSTSRALLDAAQPGCRIAAVFCLPENERALQIKGTVSAVEAPRADDWERVLAHRVAFADQIEPKGYEREFSDYYHAAAVDDLLALSFVPQELFEQTPGPQAGRCMASA